MRSAVPYILSQTKFQGIVSLAFPVILNDFPLLFEDNIKTLPTFFCLGRQTVQSSYSWVSNRRGGRSIHFHFLRPPELIRTPHLSILKKIFMTRNILFLISITFNIIYRKHPLGTSVVHVCLTS